MIYPPNIQLRLVQYLQLSDDERYTLDCEIQEELNAQMRVYGKLRYDLYEHVAPPMNGETIRLFNKRPFRAYPLRFIKNLMLKVDLNVLKALMARWTNFRHPT